MTAAAAVAGTAPVPKKAAIVKDKKGGKIGAVTAVTNTSTPAAKTTSPAASVDADMNPDDIDLDQLVIHDAGEKVIQAIVEDEQKAKVTTKKKKKGTSVKAKALNKIVENNE